jgi:signal transduction histidine kinase
MSSDPTPATRHPSGPDTAQRNYPLLLRRMERLMEITRTLTSTLDLNKLLNRIVAAARELTDSEGVSIMLVEPRTGELHFRASTQMAASDLEQIAVPLEGSIGGWVVSNGQPLLVADVRSDPRWHAEVDMLIHFRTRSILGVPLIARDRTIGVLEAVNKLSGAFTEDDESTLEWLAAQAAVAIVNARLFEQSDLVSELVHEVRTPLTALMATSQLLLRPDLPEQTQAELVATLQRETGRLSSLTTSFLDMVKLEAGRMPFTLERFDLAALLDECLEVMRPQAEQQGLTLTRLVEPGLPLLESDRGKLKQVLLNLLSNAFKYNRPQGRVAVSAAWVDGRAQVRVSDNGLGIPPGARPHIFERFYRVRDSDGYVSGTGLGLPIARRIVEALGGSIGFESEVGAGTTFFFDLPATLKQTGPLGQ